VILVFLKRVRYGVKLDGSFACLPDENHA